MIDISLTDRCVRLCSGLTRRDFLQVGSLGPLGLSLAGLLVASRHASAEPPPSSSPPPGAPSADSVILVYLGGGLSHHDTFDMKPEAPSEIRGKYGSIPSDVAGLAICELLPRMAKVMSKVCLVRSATHGNDHHETATNWVLSGRFGSPFGDYPAIGAVVAHRTGFAGTLPPYIAIPRNPSFTWELGKSAFLGGRCESFKAGDPNAAGYRVRDMSVPGGVDGSRLARRASLLQAVDRLARGVEGSDQLATYDEFQSKASEIILSARAREAFAMESEPDWLRDSYGRTTFGQGCLLSRRLVERGVRFVTINHGGWDHHGKIFQSLDRMLPELDRGLSALLADLDSRGLLDRTLVLVMGEFGRTPKLNKDAGRDHWGRAGSLIFAGAGVARGKVLGASDSEGAFVTRDPVGPADVAFTVYRSLGIDPRSHIRTADGRPMEILDQGQLIPGICS